MRFSSTSDWVTDQVKNADVSSKSAQEEEVKKN